MAQGLPYYLRFINAFPRLKDLAQADENDVLNLWQGLGYYSRARNLLHTANHIFQNLGGIFPESYDELIKLKGIGPYTAAAISSFAFDKRHAVIDGNVKRFVSRLLGISEPIESRSSLEKIQAACEKLISEVDPAMFNQAIMEFGALCCTYKSPSCSNCVFNSACQAYKLDLVDKIPNKSKRLKKRSRFLHYAFVVDKNNKTLIRRRVGKDIWSGLYEFPLIEKPELQEQSMDLADFSLAETTQKGLSSKVYKHQLTHQTLYVRFYRFNIDASADNLGRDDYIPVSIDDIQDYPLPRLIDLYLNDLSITLF